MPDGTIVVIDGTRWRRVTPQGLVTTLPATFPALGTRSIVADGNDAVLALLDRNIVRVRFDGSVTTVAPAFEAPGTGTPQDVGPVILPGGDLLVSDPVQSIIRRIDRATGQTRARVGAAPQAGRIDGTGGTARFAAMGPAAFDAAGNLYVLDTERKNLRKVTPAGVVSTLFEDFPADGAIAVDLSGRFYGVRDHAIIRVAPDGAQSVFAGRPGDLGFADGVAADARFARPKGLAFDGAGNLFVGDAPQVDFAGSFVGNTYTYGNTIRKVTPAGSVSTLSGVAGGKHGPTYTPPSGPDAYIDPVVIAVDAAGRVHVLDRSSNSIRRIDPAGGAPSLLQQAPARTMFTALAVTPAGEVHYTDVTYEDTMGESSVAVRKITDAGDSVVVAGDEAKFRLGVRLGALPGALNHVAAMVAGPDGVIHAFSENSVLRIRPA